MSAKPTISSLIWFQLSLGFGLLVAGLAIHSFATGGKVDLFSISSIWLAVVMVFFGV
jgi:hypothetical protein